jgi:hypothetical protein
MTTSFRTASARQPASHALTAALECISGGSTTSSAGQGSRGAGLRDCADEDGHGCAVVYARLAVAFAWICAASRRLVHSRARLLRGSPLKPAYVVTPSAESTNAAGAEPFSSATFRRGCGTRPDADSSVSRTTSGSVDAGRPGCAPTDSSAGACRAGSSVAGILRGSITVLHWRTAARASQKGYRPARTYRPTCPTV